MRAATSKIIGARELATIANGAAHNGRGKWLSTIFAPLAIAAEWCMDDFNPRNLAKLAWAFATSVQSDEQFFVALKRAVGRHMGKFSAQSLAKSA